MKNKICQQVKNGIKVRRDASKHKNKSVGLICSKQNKNKTKKNAPAAPTDGARAAHVGKLNWVSFTTTRTPHGGGGE